MLTILTNKQQRVWFKFSALWWFLFLLPDWSRYDHIACSWCNFAPPATPIGSRFPIYAWSKHGSFCMMFNGDLMSTWYRFFQCNEMALIVFSYNMFHSSLVQYNNIQSMKPLVSHTKSGTERKPYLCG
jgi:hypothetical protein